MNETYFRLRITFQKCGRLRLLSHLELVRAMERIIRRSQLPFAVSHGFNTHMRHAPGPALAVGTAGLDEKFDVWLTSYLRPEEALLKLKSVAVEGLDILRVKYVSPSLKGLQASHVHEVYEVVLGSKDAGSQGGAKTILDSLRSFINQGELIVQRQKKTKRYDLSVAVESVPNVMLMASGNYCVELFLRSSEQGAIKPEALVLTALGEQSGLEIKSITRTKLYEDKD